MDTTTDRRTLLKRGAAISAAAYVAPQVLSMSPAGAQTLGCYAVRITRNTPTSSCIDQPAPSGVIEDNSCDPDLETGNVFAGCTPAVTSGACSGSGMTFTNFGTLGIRVTLDADCTARFANVKTGGPGQLCSSVSGPGIASNANGSIEISGQTVTADSTNHEVSHMIVAWCCDSGSTAACP